MTIVRELERELHEMATRHAQQSRRPAGRRWRPRSRRIALAIAIVALAVTAAALAAGGVIRIGSPVHTPGTGAPHPDVGTGIVVPGTAKLLAVRTADPDGGPPWGMRIVSTTRGLGCLQVGRVVDGQLGVLGQDRVFGNDGKFHPLPALNTGFACGQLDANHRLFTNVVAGSVPAAGTPQGACFAPHMTQGVPASQICPERDERMLYFGTLGPKLASLTYHDAAGMHTVKAAGPYGAYLIVTRREGNFSNGAISSGSTTPFNTPITQLRFTTGLTCGTTPHGFKPSVLSCPIPIYRPVRKPTVTEADVRTPVHARVVHEGHHFNIVVTFRARIAVTDASSAYAITSHKHGAREFGAGSTQRNLRAGELVHQTFITASPGLHTGVVRYNPHTNGPFGVGLGGVLVGRWAARVP